MHGVPLSNGKHRKFFAETSSLIVLLLRLRFAAAFGCHKLILITVFEMNLHRKYSGIAVLLP